MILLHTRNAKKKIIISHCFMNDVPKSNNFRLQVNNFAFVWLELYDFHMTCSHRCLCLTKCGIYEWTLHQISFNNSLFYCGHADEIKFWLLNEILISWIICYGYCMFASITAVPFFMHFLCSVLFCCIFYFKNKSKLQLRHAYLWSWFRNQILLEWNSWK